MPNSENTHSQLIKDFSNFLEMKEKSESPSLEFAISLYTANKSDNWSASQKRSADLSFRKLTAYFNPNMKAADVTKLKAQEFMRSVQATAPRGYTVYYRNYRALFNWLIEVELIQLNPFKKMRFTHKQEVKIELPSEEVLFAVFNNIPNKTVTDICYTAYFTGLRLGEIINLRNKDFSYEKGIPVLTIGGAHFITKTRRQRVVPVPKPLLPILTAKIDTLKSDTDFIFHKGNGFPFTGGYISRQFKKFARIGGLDPNYHFHTIRAQYASTLLANNAHTFQVSRLLGHTSIKTTECYLQTDVNLLYQSIQSLNNSKGLQ